MQTQRLANGNMNLIHKPHYPVAMQMAKKFVKKIDIRPQLQMVYHDEQGGIWATDSNRLLHVADVHGYGKRFDGGVLVNPKTFEMAENHLIDADKGHRFYPNVQGIVPERKDDLIILEGDQLKVWHQAHKSMKQMSDAVKHENYHVKLAIKQHHDGKSGLANEIKLLFKSENTVTDMKLPFQKVNYIGSELVGEDFLTTICYNALYVADVFETMIKLKVEQVGIQITGIHSPFVFRSEDEKVMAMVLPVRVY